jgi:hypothetical protein
LSNLRYQSKSRYTEGHDNIETEQFIISNIQSDTKPRDVFYQQQSVVAVKTECRLSNSVSTIIKNYIEHMMMYAFFWVIPRRLNFICRNSSYLPAYEDETDRMFRNVGI